VIDVSLHASVAAQCLFCPWRLCNTGTHRLLKGENGKVGELEVNKDGERIVLNQAFAAAKVGDSGNLSESASDADAVRTQFGATIAARPERPSSFTLYFEESTTEVVAASKGELERMFAEVRKRQAPDVQVTGHTDRIGKIKDNNQLGSRRAGAVRSVLIKLGLDAQLVSAVSRGEREPIVLTVDEVNEPKNRRVEVTVR
jgi:outer membrane protein OmpA-like peptidoglycan-associated protein